MAATLSDLVYEAKREAGALVAELELEFGPLGVAMKALRLYERIQAIERELEQQRRPANEIPSGCVRCAFGALPFVPSRSGRGMERCDCARWLMGLPPVWDDCGVTAMEFVRRRRRRS